MINKKQWEKLIKVSEELLKKDVEELPAVKYFRKLEKIWLKN